jgi:hypothetical protein
MMTATRKRVSDFVWMVLGAFSMLVAAPIVIESWNWLQDGYDRAHPPAKAVLVSHEFVEPTTLRMRFIVTRSSRACEFVRLTGFTGATLGQMQIATTLRREDGQDPASYPAGSTVTSQPWVMSPVYGGQLLIVGHYDCTGRMVRTRLIDEVLR